MKKIYLSLFLTITTLTTSCCEKPRVKAYRNDTSQYPNIIFNPTSSAYPLVVFSPMPSHHQQQAYEQIVNTKWEKYNEIMDMTYKRDPVVEDSTKLLIPVYNKQSKSTEQEKKPLLLTSSLRLDQTVIELLYNKSFRIVFDEYRNKRLEQKNQNKRLVRLINRMNNARNNGIHEDSMGRFAHNKKRQVVVNDIDMTQFGSLFFSLLKKYTLTVHETGEQLPLHFDAKKPRLKEILTISSDTNEQSVASNTTHTHADFLLYPAFFQLTYALRHAMQELDISFVNIFTTYLYENDGILLQDHSHGTYENFKNEFYTHAYNMLLHNGNTHDLYHLIQMIDKAKNARDIINEDELAADIIGFESPTSFKNLCCWFFDSIYSPENVKKRISVFCALVKKYNDARLTKTTPTAKQYEAYTVIKELDIAAVHDSLCNNTLFDENRYAFGEFKELLERTQLLKRDSENKVNRHIDTLSSQKKIVL